jgi:hypothetical protein
MIVMVEVVVIVLYFGINYDLNTDSVYVKCVGENVSFASSPRL